MMKFSCTIELCCVLNIFFYFTLRIHDASDFGIVDITGKYSYIQNLCHSRTTHKPDFLHQLSHCPHRFDIFSHDNTVACTRILRHSNPHVCSLPRRVSGIPATVMLVIGHLSL
jgi:hypothetical protein